MGKKIKIAVILFILIGLFFPFPQQSETPLENDVLIRYTLSGGIAGIHDTLSILSSGEALLLSDNSLKTLSLTQDDIDVLKDSIDQRRYDTVNISVFTYGLETLKKPLCCDMLFSEYIVQRNNHSIIIEPDYEITGIVQSTYTELKQ